MLDGALDVTLLATAVLAAVRVVLPLALTLGGRPAPVPGGAEEEQAFDPNDVTPGTVGFIATFLMVVAVVFLIRDMSRRVRRINLEGRAREERASGGAAGAAPPEAAAAARPRSSGEPVARAGGPSAAASRAGAGGRPGRTTKPPRGLRSIRPPVRGEGADESGADPTRDGRPRR